MDSQPATSGAGYSKKSKNLRKPANVGDRRFLRPKGGLPRGDIILPPAILLDAYNTNVFVNTMPYIVTKKTKENKTDFWSTYHLSYFNFFLEIL